MAQYYEAVGRRKESTARVRLMDGSGTFTVNDKEGAVYFPRVGDLQDILRAFDAVGQEASKYDISVKGRFERCSDAVSLPSPIRKCAKVLNIVK